MESGEWVLQLIWRILPAYIANAAPVVFVRKGHPIDFGKKWRDGNPILGKGKTFEGFIVGVTAGLLTGLIQNRVAVSLMLAVGAMIGDLAGSFLKRRLGIRRSGPAPLLDQMSFLIGAIALSSILEPYTLEEVAVLILITIPLHLITNVFAYFMKLKKVPW
ncbi:MAG: CDP-2,3-bis-(O-geranylgeranyl)-sn-glycerol synthase [Candidatus Methanomethylicota archaeon]|uniref:CDP-archaeol synthase n=1 Tax=Thermoproteota archaeon TaxID=2056631 RepID=A0A497F7V3_9CREN|nr:MAG: CDP-2,3-bis-(O-geranylgeranyl)-sn-glycerol synthase [Candidatus Verstraetearchaeota archaeon]RLE55693.1 MAG: CDP-2,3-bis-(O-geranylgeranyl)-sn-glycerol synthase [Candidatus Verstraetearchaeota archaeon]